MIKNIRIDFSYDGSKFYGFQKQIGLRTVQGEIEEAIKKVTGKSHRLISSGRTDSGVHAIKQTANFLDVSNIRPDSMKYHLRRELTNDILVYDSKEVDLSFNSRFDCKNKTYIYLLSNDKYMHPIYNNYMGNVIYDLDYEKMLDAKDVFLGIHDFRGFSKSEDKEFTIREINSFDIKRKDFYTYIFEVNGNSFLRNQVRIMVGALVDVGRGYLNKDDLLDVLENKDRTKLGKTITGKGLYLKEANY